MPYLSPRTLTRSEQEQILRVEVAWHAWQTGAGFDHRYPFHALRHSAVTHVRWAFQPLFVAQLSGSPRFRRL